MNVTSQDSAHNATPDDLLDTSAVIAATVHNAVEDAVAETIDAPMEKRHKTDDPSTLAERTTTVIRLGSLLLASGTGGYRVKRAMQRAAFALGIDRFDASVTLTNVTVTAYGKDDCRTLVSEAPAIGVNASRIEALERISRDISHGITNADLNDRIDHFVKGGKPLYGVWANGLASGFACAAFAVLNKFPPEALLFVLIGATLGQMTRRHLSGRGWNQMGVAALSATVASLIYLVCVSITAKLVPGFIYNSANAGFAPVSAGFVASVLFLIPGFPMFTSLLDLAKLDFSAGIQRFTYVVSLLAAATGAVWIVTLATGLQPLPQIGNPYVVRFGAEWWPLYVWVASFVGISGFAVLFNCSHRMVLLSAATGATGNLIKFILIDRSIVGLDLPLQFGAFIGALFIGLVASVIAPPMRLPRITLSVPSSVIMIPGTSMYRFIYFLNTGDIGLASRNLMDASLVVVGIGAGLAIARMLTDPEWLYDRRHPQFHRGNLIGRTQRAILGMRAAHRAAKKAIHTAARHDAHKIKEEQTGPTQHAISRFRD